MKSKEFPQRYYDALENPNPTLKNPLSKWFAVLFIKGDPIPSQAQMEHYGRLMMVGDPEADTWGKLENASNRRKWYKLFNEALENGTSSVRDIPDELVALLRKAENEPLWLDRRLLDIAAKAHCRVGPFATLVMRSIGLMGGYMSAPITKPLIFTGALETGTSRRLTETANFAIDVTRAGGLERNAPGFKTALRVRMMHGLIRKRILAAPGWRTDLWGIPVNQADMIVTQLTMSYVFIFGHQMLGFRFADEEIIAILHLWRYVGYLMGIDDSQLPTTEQEARKIMALAVTLQAGPDQDSIALAEALRHVDFEEDNTRLAKLFAPVTSKLHQGLSRLVLGTELSESLGIPDTRWKYWPFAFTPAMFMLETARQHIPLATTLANRVGHIYRENRLKARLKGKKSAYVPAVELTDRAK